MAAPLVVTQTANSSSVGAGANQPDNENYLSPLGYRFGVRKLPHVNWFVQTITLPGITLNEVTQPSPLLDTAHPGEKITFDPLSITFKVDEDLENWIEIQNWIRIIAPPDVSERRKQGIEKLGREAIFSDASLIIMNSNMNANFEVHFYDLFPTTLSELEFTSVEGDVNYLTATASFRYTYYDFRKIDR